MLSVILLVLDPLAMLKKYHPVCPRVLESILRKRSNSSGCILMTQSRFPASKRLLKINSSFNSKVGFIPSKAR